MFRFLKMLPWAIYVFAFPTLGTAANVERDAILTFDYFCVQIVNSPETFPETLKKMGVSPLSNSQAQPMLNGQSGNVWFMPGGSKIVLTLTTSRICTVTALDANPNDARAAFNTAFNSRLMISESVGSQQEEYYALTSKDSKGANDIHTVVSIVSSKLANEPGIIINSIPERIFQPLGLKIPQWP